MRRYLYISLVHVAAGIWLATFIGCVHRVEAPVTCVPVSIVSAWTLAQSGYEVRVAVQRIEPGVDHAQAEALIGGKWTPVTVGWDRRGLIVHEHRRHFDVEPYRTLSLDEWIQEQSKFRR